MNDHRVFDVPTLTRFFDNARKTLFGHLRIVLKVHCRHTVVAAHNAGESHHGARIASLSLEGSDFLGYVEIIVTDTNLRNGSHGVSLR